MFDLDLGLEAAIQRPFKPKSILHELKMQLFQNVPESVKAYARELQGKDWRFYAVSQDRGTCYLDAKVITIPDWVIIKRPIKEKIWYISHELSHAFDTSRSAHGPAFMSILKDICPEDCIEYELGYKPRNARAAGIGAPKPITLLDL